MTKTVGTDATSCAASSSITVPYGSTVYYCYSVENTGNVTLTTHTVVDDVLGTVLGPDASYNLAPVRPFAFTSTHAAVTETVTAGALWSLCGWWRCGYSDRFYNRHRTTAHGCCFDRFCRAVEWCYDVGGDGRVDSRCGRGSPFGAALRVTLRTTFEWGNRGRMA
ncbi:MAG: hypothetical protein IPL78_13120 [Chloroflexi bacterium]|nr:hypothetical protein [Chloroflexota bacterium]